MRKYNGVGNTSKRIITPFRRVTAEVTAFYVHQNFAQAGASRGRLKKRNEQRQELTDSAKSELTAAQTKQTKMGESTGRRKTKISPPGSLGRKHKMSKLNFASLEKAKKAADKKVELALAKHAAAEKDASASKKA